MSMRASAGGELRRAVHAASLPLSKQEKGHKRGMATAQLHHQLTTTAIDREH